MGATGQSSPESRTPAHRAASAPRTIRATGARQAAPAAVVDGVIGLDRCNDFLLCEARNGLCQQVLRGFDPEAAIAWAVAFRGLGIHDEIPQLLG